MNPLLYRMEVTDRHQVKILAAVLVIISTVDWLGSLI